MRPYLRRLTLHQAIILSALTISLVFAALLCACKNHATGPSSKVEETVQPPPIVIPISDGFDYPFGSVDPHNRAKEKVGWYDAQNFGANDHLGEDWNTKTGGNTDCGSPVYAASKGTIVFADNAGPGWGNVLIVRHRLPAGTLVETLYGHLQSFTKTSGEVNRREVVGNIGDGGGAYLCHLHFELRFANCPSWGQPGAGYGSDKTGWTQPSDFINANRSFKNSQIGSGSNR